MNVSYFSALQQRLDAMRTRLRQSLSDNGMNYLPDSSGTSSSSDIFRQLFGVQGGMPSGGTRTIFVRQSRRMLNGPKDSNILNSQRSGNENVNNNNIVQNGLPGNSNSASDISVVVVNQNQGASNNGGRNVVGENMSSNFGASVTDIGSTSQSGILLPDSVLQTNTSSFPQMFSSPFSSSASFWSSSSNRGGDPVSPTQPPVSDSTSAQGGGFNSIFSASPATSFSRVTFSTNQQPFDTSAWNRFMTTSGSGSSTSGIDISTNDQSSRNTEMNPTPSGDTTANFDNSQPVTFTNTASGGPDVNLAGTTFSGTSFSGESITTQEPAVSCCMTLLHDEFSHRVS